MRLNLILLIVLLLHGIASYAEQKPAERLQNVQKEIKTLSADLDQNKASKQELYDQLKNQSKRISALNRKLLDLKSKIDAKQSELTQLQKRYGVTQKQQKQQLDALYAQIRSAFMNAQPSYLKILLNEQDPTKVARSSVYYHYFHQAREKQLKQLNQTLANLSSEQKAVYSAQKSLQQLYTDQSQQQAALKQQVDNRKTTLALLDKKINSQGAKLAALKEEQQNLVQLLQSLNQRQKQHPQTAVKPNKPFASLNGALNWPVRGKLLVRYGSPRNLGKLTWQGIMISSPPGSEVKAAASGRVVFADWLRGFGLLIIIDHGDQYMSLYGNNETLLKHTGDVVKAGEVIARSGSEGVRPLAGLYFEVRHKGNPTNPLKWLSKQG